MRILNSQNKDLNNQNVGKPIFFYVNDFRFFLYQGKQLAWVPPYSSSE